MKRFTQLFTALDESNRTQDKVAALKTYFLEAPPEDASWALFFLAGNRLPAPVKTKAMRAWAAQLAEYPLWLVEASYDHVGDLAETLALILPETTDELEPPPLHQLMEETVLSLRDWDEPVQFQIIREVWAQLSTRQRLVFNKLITGAFRVGVSRTLVVRALAQAANLEPAVMEHRLMGKWQPSAQAFRALFTEEDDAQPNPARPYPFYLAYALEGEPDELGRVGDWQAEWKWDGIRAQLIKRQGQVMLWSRGDAMVTEQFPEIAQAAARLPDGTVLDGEVLAWNDGTPLGFAVLQTRLGRKRLSAAILEEAPVAFLAYDCLETGGKDIRSENLDTRRTHLDNLLGSADPAGALLRSVPVTFPTWQALVDLRQESRTRGVEGLMLKRKASPYRVGRIKGDWWKWKIQPYAVDAVMVYAQAGHGRRSGLYTDYTFALHDGEGALVPFAKAYSGLSDEEIRRVDRWVKAHTLDRHGPVRVVEPQLVFELHFEGIAASTRHKSGLAVRFPRIARWREDKTPADADTLETVRALLQAQPGADALAKDR
ncbi:MAG: ATP-dependent DNA ligase [Verrucomicrobiota bacterium]